MGGRSMIFVGGLIIVIGVIFLLNNLGLTSIGLGSLITKYWPVALILWGFDLLGSEFVGRRNQQEKREPQASTVITGLILLVIGLLILGRNLELIDFDLSFLWKIFWPLVIILIGWSLIRGTKRMSGTKGTHWAVMSGLEFKSKGWKLDDANVIAFMGGADMDLTAAEIPEREVVLNLTAILGGITLYVPRDINIVYEGTAVLGGITFLREEGGGIIAGRKTEYTGDPASRKKLIIKALTALGGIEVKN
ncbi:MAG: LiaF domain-containing protein [Thermacetogeniaceae bacterium]|nr:LiaF-related protein [Thermoanaerobacterales bacterium]NLN21114.1 cell wall-active antibiotics response protein [Syntrophomonadaceae bacterium]HAF17429.1 hypothetical protein [Peptococcaceae bacterium]